MSLLISTSYRVKCSKCDSRAIVRVPYAKLNLCREHFLEYVERRVYKSIERYKMLKGIKKILVAISGGKDSLSLLYILSALKHALGLEAIYCFHLDLGISAYSEMSRKAVESACSETNTECIIMSLNEALGYTLPELVNATKRPACSVCGMLKRYFANLVAVELGVDALSLGHHMDDILVFILKDFVLQDLVDMSKMVPVTPGTLGIAATRLKVLYEIYENDLALYASLRNIKYVEAHCPFKYQDPFKTAIRKMLDELEEVAPGLKLSFARRFAKNLSKYTATRVEKIMPCKHCGMPSSTGTCSICKLTERVEGKPLGPLIREKVREALKCIKRY